MAQNTIGTLSTLDTESGQVAYYRLAALAGEANVNLDRMPVTIKILLENMLRLSAAGMTKQEDILKLAAWKPGAMTRGEFPFLPTRVV